jgi:thiol-disulfide isomerase/thioredoxin
MKTKHLLLCIILFIANGKVFAQSALTKVAYIYEGSKMDNYPQVEWLNSKPLTTLDKDKLYIVELWATWCVPCIAVMPHLNELNMKFKDKNVVFIAQDIMENDKNRVEDFLKKKGKDISYPVAFGGGEGSDFDKKWLKLAGVTTIPQTFVIQNNILIWQTTPDMLNEQVIQLMLDGKFTKDAAKRLVGKN